MDLDIVLFGDCFLHIKNNCCPKDLWLLAQTCHYYNKLIIKDTLTESLLNQINKRLYYIFGDNLSIFKEEMKNNNAVISGSFIIQCILGEYWKDSDIDIYIPRYYADNHNLTISGNQTSSIDKFLLSFMKVSDSKWLGRYRQGREEITQVRTFERYYHKLHQPIKSKKNVSIRKDPLYQVKNQYVQEIII